jgi:hypothetical protein
VSGAKIAARFVVLYLLFNVAVLSLAVGLYALMNGAAWASGLFRFVASSLPSAACLLKIAVFSLGLSGVTVSLLVAVCRSKDKFVNKPAKFSLIIRRVILGDKLHTTIAVFAAVTALFGVMALTEVTVAKANGFTDTVYREEILLSDKQIVNISAVDIPITVTASNTDRVFVSYVGANSLTAVTADYSVEIAEDDGAALTLISPSMFDYRLDIVLPTRVYTEINVHAKSGPIELYNLQADILKVYTDSGNVTAYGGDLESNVQSNSGDVTVYIASDYPVTAEFSTERGIFTSDAFEDRYVRGRGSVTFSRGDSPKTWKVKSTSGDYSIYVNK